MRVAHWAAVAVVESNAKKKSCKLVWPGTTAPACCNRTMPLVLSLGTWPCRAQLPALVGIPFTSMVCFTTNGRPYGVSCASGEVAEIAGTSHDTWM